MVRAKTKSTSLEMMAAITKIDRGKYTLVIREVELTRELQAPVREVANKFHGKRAVNKKIEYGMLLVALVGILRIIEKANDMTSI